MGAEIGAAAISGGSNILSAGANLYMNEKNLDAQREENQKDRDFNAAEAEKARVYSTNERIAQQLYNTSERQAAQTYQTGERLATQQYNSAKEQASRLRAAGINPAVYFSGAGGSSQASSPMSSAGASSSVPSAAQASFSGGLNTQIPNMPQLLTGASELINALTNADVGKANIDLLNANTKIALESVFTQQQITQAMKLQNQLNEANLPHATKKLIAEVGALNAQIHMTKEQTEKAKLEKRLVKAQTKLAKQQSKLTGFEAVTAGILTKKADRLFEADIESKQAGASESRAAAQEHAASAENIGIFNKLHSDQRFKWSFLSQCVDQARSVAKQNKITDKQLKIIEEQIEAAVYANDNKEFTYWSDRLFKTIETTGSAASQFYGAGAIRQLISIRSQGQNAGPVLGKDGYWHGSNKN